VGIGIGQALIEERHTFWLAMSGLTKRIVYADHYLAVILGVSEGSLVSYSEISRGLHDYIKRNDLKNPDSVKRIVHMSESTPQTVGGCPPIAWEGAIPVQQAKQCRSCGEEISSDAVYCDMCGVLL
jgi:hypothetical protein